MTSDDSTYRTMDRGLVASVFPYLFWPFWVLTVSSALVLGFASSLGAYSLGLVTPVVLVSLSLIEGFRPITPDRTLRNDPQRFNNVGHIILGGVAGETIGNLVIIAGAAALAAILPPLLDIWPHAWPVAGQVVLLVVGADLLEYWRHRLLHRNSFLWRAHALHHDVDRLHAINSSRNHVLDLLSRAAVVFAPIALLGAPALWLPAYSAALLVVSPLSHANIELRVPRWAVPLLLTPDLHAIHHAKAVDQADSNFAAVFPVWDVLFGTYRPPTAELRRPDEMGIGGETWPDDFWAQLTAPFRPRPGGR